MILRLAALLLVTVSIAACGSEPPFDPTATCRADGTGGGDAPGAFPDLEARVPAAFEGRAADELNSGRSCPQSLGTLAGRGVTEMRFAGGIWRLAERSGFTLALFSAPGLQADWMAEFYESTAHAARQTEEITRSAPRFGGDPATRIDVLNGQSFQSIVVLPAFEDGSVPVVLVASEVQEVQTRAAHDERVRKAVAAWQASPGDS